MHKLSLVFLLAVGCCANTFASAAIMAPFNSDFSSTIDPNPVAKFSPTLSGQWDIVANKYRNIIPANTSSSSTLDFSNLGGLNTTDFLLSTTFSFSGSVSDSGTNSIGFAVLSSSANATTSASNSFYLADVSLGGPIKNAQLRLTKMENLFSTSLTEDIDLQTVLEAGKLYLLQLAGEYSNAGNLKLTLSLRDESLIGDNLIGSTNANIVPTVFTGTNFGLRNRATGGPLSALTVDFDSVNVVAIPEPSSVGFVAVSLIAGYGIGWYVRRRMASPMI